MKIALLLPALPDFGWLWRCGALADILASLTDFTGAGVEVVIGLPKCREDKWRAREIELKQLCPSAVVRHLGWERVDVDLAIRMYGDSGQILDGIEQISLPRDWGWNFVDCDAWLVLADAGLGAIVPLRPTAYWVRDLGVRYFPEAYAPNIRDGYWKRQEDAFRLWRQSRAVICTDPATADDINSYAGVKRDRIVILPPVLPSRTSPAPSSRQVPCQLLWFAEPRADHDLPSALEGLRLAFAECDRFEVTVISSDPEPIEAMLAQSRRRWRNSENRIELESASNEAMIQHHVSRATAIWSSALADGENEGVVRAAAAALPFVGFSYPQNRDLVERLVVPGILYAKNDALSIAAALLARANSTEIKTDRQAPYEHWAFNRLLDRLTS